MCVRKALERLALLHRFPFIFLQLAGMVLANSSIDIALQTLFRQLLVFYHVVSMGAAFYDNGI